MTSLRMDARIVRRRSRSSLSFSEQAIGKSMRLSWHSRFRKGGKGLVPGRSLDCVNECGFRRSKHFLFPQVASRSLAIFNEDRNTLHRRTKVGTRALLHEVNGLGW